MSDRKKTRFDVNATTDYEMSNGTPEYYYTPISKVAQAEYEALYGYPTDADKVWAHRDELADTEKGQE